MLNDAGFYSNFISTHQQGTEQLFIFSLSSELTAVSKRGVDEEQWWSHYPWGYLKRVDVALGDVI